MRRLPIIVAAIGLVFPILLSAEVNMSQYVSNPDSKGSDVSSYSKFNDQTNTSLDFKGLILKNKGSDAYLRHYYEKIGIKSADIDKFFKYIENKGIPQAEDKSTTIFFLTSGSVPISNTTNFMVGFDRLKKKNPDLQGYVVLNGFIKKAGGVKGYMESTGVKASATIVKVHPFLFKKVKVEKVPAFIISECPIIDFKERFCDHKLIAYGAMPLEQFLNIVEEKSSEEKYKKLYYDLINPN